MFEKRENVTTEEALRKACEENGLIYDPNINYIIDESTKKSVDFTDEEFCGMLGFIIGYTSYGEEYNELRTDLINEVYRETGKDLTKCWIWM